MENDMPSTSETVKPGISVKDTDKTKSPEHKKHLSKKVLIARLGGVLLALAGLGAAAATKYHLDFDTPNTPAGIIEDIKGIPTEWGYTIEQWKQNKSVSEKLNKPVSPYFDNAVDTQIVQAGINTTPISKEELPLILKDSIKPVEQGKFPKPTILLPLKLTDGEKVDIETYWTRSFNPINPESKDPIASGKIFTIAKKGTEIVVPVDGSRVFIGTAIVNDKSYIGSGYGIFFNGPDGTEYQLGITTPEDIRLLQPTDSIRNAILNNENNLNLSVGTTIASTSTDNVKMEISLSAYPPGYPKNRVGIPCNYNLIEKVENGKTVIAFIPQSTP